MDIRDRYATRAPNTQDTVDLFKGEWSSRLPDVLGDVQAGSIPLFDDERVRWAVAEMGGVAGKSVLELGPLEGGHTYMLEQLGAVAITAVEANTRAYLKCLITKELLGLRRVTLLFGDCVEFLKTNEQKFDVCLASGILYHMRNPVELIALLAGSCERLFVWTHYYDQALIAAGHLSKRFATVPQAAEHAGFAHGLYRQDYGRALGWGGFCGGGAEHSNWMTRQAILDAFAHFGFTGIRTNYEHPDHPNGPAFAFVAARSG